MLKNIIQDCSYVDHEMYKNIDKSFLWFCENDTRRNQNGSYSVTYLRPRKNSCESQESDRGKTMFTVTRCNDSRVPVLVKSTKSTKGFRAGGIIVSLLRKNFKAMARRSRNPRRLCPKGMTEIGLPRTTVVLAANFILPVFANWASKNVTGPYAPEVFAPFLRYDPFFSQGFALDRVHRSTIASTDRFTRSVCLSVYSKLAIICPNNSVLFIWNSIRSRLRFVFTFREKLASNGSDIKRKLDVDALQRVRNRQI